MSTITTKDGTEIYDKGFGRGGSRSCSAMHAWPLSSDDWDEQMLSFGEHGFRCIAHDRRSHGRPTRTWDGNDMDTISSELVKGARLKLHPGLSHRRFATHHDVVTPRTARVLQRVS